MKKKYYILASMLACLTSFTGCVGDLDVQPLDSTVVTAERAYTDAASYTKGLNKIYSVWALSGQGGDDSDIAGLDAGNTVLLRCWWTMQEQTTDELKNAENKDWVGEINNLTWSTSKNEIIEGVYQRCMFVVALSNEFMKNIDNAPVEVDQKSYAAQARFNRALAYYILLDAYAKPPFITENNYSLTPSQLSRPELFDWIESELNTIRTDLPATRAEYGRADQTVVDALLARMYLNAEVYTGQARYTDCIAACKRIIPHYSLAKNYDDLFKADNGENPETLKEIIYPVIFDGKKTQSWGMAALVVGSRKEAGGGVREGWSQFRGTQNLVELFDFADNANRKPGEILDKRGIFDDYNGKCNYQITTGVTGNFDTEGWGVPKYSNLTSTGAPGQDVLWVDTDFPLFRLGDVYLMYAESVARGGEGGDMDTAVDYVNKLRDRGYGDTPHNKIDAAWLKANNYQNILNERGRELYWEGVRRMDLIRYGKFTGSSYTWPSKGGVITGVGVNERYNIFPIPVSDISVNGSLEQNEGYK
ncbi:RagB/SusD family nutrient uptake outer membrane protein [Bacteroides sp. HF-5092]|uniref:RagB/SusD family nutrient uptake outer membrane protein n=1 Tax=Bacteroides TaxID=816 RepID=UPI0011773290|nr:MULTISPECIES: RagB/SusD family nutrient uptake outer membrane protein [Bacteroides]TRX47830.1 RagB/SusD family nutrient uptake outer membrane protein [Bacteroides sp. HF-5092]